MTAYNYRIEVSDDPDSEGKLYKPQYQYIGNPNWAYFKVIVDRVINYIDATFYNVADAREFLNKQVRKNNPPTYLDFP